MMALFNQKPLIAIWHIRWCCFNACQCKHLQAPCALVLLMSACKDTQKGSARLCNIIQDHMLFCTSLGIPGSLSYLCRPYHAYHRLATYKLEDDTGKGRWMGRNKPVAEEAVLNYLYDEGSCLSVSHVGAEPVPVQGRGESRQRCSCQWNNFDFPTKLEKSWFVTAWLSCC